MRILSFLILLVLITIAGYRSDHPHGAGFKISCSKCHSSKGWELDKTIYSFDHNATRMPLTGQHTNADCRQCHISLVFSEAKAECISCHNDIHQGTTEPECSRCHNTSSWLVNNITQMHQMSRFPLLGPHRTAECISCHKLENPLRFDVPGVNCIDCHLDKFQAATNPNHIQAGFSEDCSGCHPITAFQWTGVGFNHNFFPLVQGHAIPSCSGCHTGGNYAKISTDCYSCHQANYLATTNPNHIDANFPVTCATCHSLAPGWKPATFNHSIFPLTLGHSTPACTDCHIGGNYTTTPTDCYACHKTNYDNTTNPNHAALNFSTTCTLCHTTNPGWTPASYTQHDSQYFPIYSGRHRGAWKTCTDCHPNPANYTLFNCIACHANAHSGENYTNAQCYQCHPTGSGGRK
jgi:hypothetical protein